MITYLILILLITDYLNWRETPAYKVHIVMKEISNYDKVL